MRLKQALDIGLGVVITGRDLANPDNYRIDAITNFGSKDPFKSKVESFYSSDIRDLAEAARFAGIEYKKELNIS